MAPSPVHGVLLVDKPEGPTSHDVVARVRRALGTRRVGHAGTLDPAASGLLVVLCGEAAKLAPYLTASDKAYRATVALGRATDTLDAEGTTTHEALPPPPILEELERLERDPRSADAPAVRAALAAESARTVQAPPVYSAIKVRGVRSHALSRAGDAPSLPPREVAVRAIAVVGASRSGATLSVDLDVSKGYYVRSFARDLGERLGAPSHLASLRRTQSGPFSVDAAVRLEDIAPDRLMPCARAAALALPAVRLDPDAERRARQGKTVAISPALAAAGPVALCDASGEHLVAVATADASGTARILRGFGGGA